MEPNTHFCWEKDTAKSWGQTEKTQFLPSVASCFSWRDCVTMHNFVKEVIINHDTKYQRNRNREPWGLLLP